MPRAFDARIAATATSAPGGTVGVVVADNRAAAIAEALLASCACRAGDALPAVVGPGPAATGTGCAAQLRHTAGSAVADLIGSARPARAAAAVVAAGAVGAVPSARFL